MRKGLNDAAPRHRKQMFMSLMDREHRQWLQTLACSNGKPPSRAEAMPNTLHCWTKPKNCCGVAYAWCDVRRAGDEAVKRAADFGVIVNIDGSCGAGPRHLSTLRPA